MSTYDYGERLLRIEVVGIANTHHIPAVKASAHDLWSIYSIKYQVAGKPAVTDKAFM
ncbi:hypothetical protein FOTG_14631 [Fusarium oxysporum f. sp. vasinfectum 25433]|uniref:Uncharacterized protein n=1 Tax=Fusarium oxysporum f. sp. vasinfectum 25433 TaxID=1089449 RepID=X0L834_FUSOX|nr:hypothetical protein FOTG_14631 [Fusarium oxysporum f. sp. vasinfectum 25433]